MTDYPQEGVDQILWLMSNSDGVTGLRLDGPVMPWDEVCRLYLPWWQGRLA